MDDKSPEIVQNMCDGGMVLGYNMQSKVRLKLSAAEIIARVLWNFFSDANDIVDLSGLKKNK